jgi:hypothetical protein
LITRYTFFVPRFLQETAQLEADAFVRRQQVALAAEVKAVLDSWVRFEQQEKENEQARLVKTIVDNVLKNISEEKTQKDVLAWAVTEVEREYPFPFSFFSPPHVSIGSDGMVQSWSRPRRYRL